MNKPHRAPLLAPCRKRRAPGRPANTTYRTPPRARHRPQIHGVCRTKNLPIVKKGGKGYGVTTQTASGYPGADAGGLRAFVSGHHGQPAQICRGGHRLTLRYSRFCLSANRRQPGGHRSPHRTIQRRGTGRHPHPDAQLFSGAVPGTRHAAQYASVGAGTGAAGRDRGRRFRGMGAHSESGHPRLTGQRQLPDAGRHPLRILRGQPQKRRACSLCSGFRRGGAHGMRAAADEDRNHRQAGRHGRRYHR